MTEDCLVFKKKNKKKRFFSLKEKKKNNYDIPELNQLWKAKESLSTKGDWGVGTQYPLCIEGRGVEASRGHLVWDKEQKGWTHRSDPESKTYG